MPLNGTIKHGQNLLMVKFHVIHTSQLLKKKENGGGGTRQEEEEEERRQREPQRRCRFRGCSERARSAAGGPRRRGGAGQQHAKEAQQPVQPRWSRGRAPSSTLSMAGAVMVTGHSFQPPSLAPPCVSTSVLPNTTTLPHHHICQSKRDWPNYLGLFWYHKF